MLFIEVWRMEWVCNLPSYSLRKFVHYLFTSIISPISSPTTGIRFETTSRVKNSTIRCAAHVTWLESSHACFAFSLRSKPQAHYTTLNNVLSIFWICAPILEFMILSLRHFHHMNICLPYRSSPFKVILIWIDSCEKLWRSESMHVVRNQ